jgi:hypothetical protein
MVPDRRTALTYLGQPAIADALQGTERPAYACVKGSRIRVDLQLSGAGGEACAGTAASMVSNVMSRRGPRAVLLSL